MSKNNYQITCIYEKKALTLHQQIKTITIKHLKIMEIKNQLRNELEYLVGKRINKNNIGADFMYLLQFVKNLPQNVKFIYVETPKDELTETEDFRYIWEILDENDSPLYSGNLWYLKTRNSKLIYITEIMVD